MKPAEKTKVKALLAHTAETTAALTRKRMGEELQAKMAQAQAPQGPPPGAAPAGPPQGQPPAPPPQGMQPPPPQMRKGGKVESKWPFEGKTAKQTGPKAKKSASKGNGIAQRGKTKGRVV